MEPTMAPMMMLVTVIPETEEERAEGGQSVLNRRPPVAFLVDHTNTREFTNHKQTAAGHGIQQEKSSRRRREEGRGEERAAVAPLKRSGGLLFRKA